MILNRLLDVIHGYTKNFTEKSIILKNLDNIIFPIILLNFFVSLFVSTDTIGNFIIIIIALTAVRIIFTAEDKLKCEKFELFLLGYFMVLLISLAGSSLFLLSFKGFMKAFIYLGYYLSVVHHLKYNRNHIIPILLTISGCIMIESLTGLLQSFSKVDEISGWQDMSNLNPEEVITRVYGTMLPLNPNLLGGYFVMTIPCLIGLFGFFINDKRYLLSIATGICACFASIVLFLTGCRGAYIGLLSILMGIFLISLKLFWEKYKKIYISISTFFTAMIGMAICAVTPVRMRVLSIFAMRNDSSNSFRFNVYKSSFQMFKDNWLVGIGHGNQNFREIYGLYMKTGFDALSAYNIYLEIAVESGIFALLLFLGFLFKILQDGIKYLIHENNIKNITLASIPILSIIGAMTHGMVDTVFFRPQLQIVFWTMCAILSNVIYSSKIATTNQN